MAVTPINVGPTGLKNAVSSTQSRPQFTINRPPPSLLQPPMVLQSPFVPQQHDQLASGGQDSISADIPESAGSHSLFYLGPSGPSMPVFGQLRQDLGQMMTSFMRGPLRKATADLKETAREPVMSRVGYAISKMMGGHMGDRSFDGFDWVPLIALLVATALILSGLFPTGLNTLGINQGQFVIGRNGRVEDESVIDQALGEF